MKSAADPVTQKAGDVTTELELLRGRVAELTAQLDLRDDFIAIVGHELRNPLSPLYLLVHLLRQELEHGPPEVSRDAVARHINRIDDGLRRLTLLLDRVFDVSRIGSDQLVLRRERVDLSEHVRTWLVNHDAELHAARCEVRCEIEPGVTGEWDRARIEQILDNVVGNAMRYGAGQPIEIRVATDGAYAVVQVRDHGIGIDPADHARVFERYVRGDRGRRGAGLGVGLWVVDNVCRAMGGSIQLDSRPGCGATFTIRIPVA